MAGRLLVPVACALCSWNAADRLASNAYGSVVAVRGKVSSTATLTPPWGPPPGSAAEKQLQLFLLLATIQVVSTFLAVDIGITSWHNICMLWSLWISQCIHQLSMFLVSLAHTHKMHHRCASHLGFWKRNILVCVTLTRMENHCGWISATRYTSSWFRHLATDLLWKWEWSTLSGLRKSYRQSPGEALNDQVATLEYFELGLVNWLVIGAN